MITAERILDLVRDPIVPRADAIALLQAFASKHAEHAAHVASNLAYDQVLALLDHRDEISTRDTQDAEGRADPAL